ncbi:LLM class flavin-dependent oxidoreductase [Bhargavaea ginsengi]|uniref:LLM class flavin-dependent oxidoreductase n=1 Tax=Bhargavaea ginsengi TaxID=426757 RepID=UPI00203ACEF8|nr:LLM class flavin-dependent oxidoreductase [Bhargavaea ginsengi]MCM3086480.1 LLM class flavin-dependent oxidoreductase [Bhargavaea ginsengi]
MVTYNILDYSPIDEGSDARKALLQTVELARLAEKLGYRRFWVSEHHHVRSVAGSSPEMLMMHLADSTEHIRIGSGGIMLPHYSPYKVAENFRVLEALHPNRIDLGIGRSPSYQLVNRALNESKGKRLSYEQQIEDIHHYLTEKVINHRFRDLTAMPVIDTAPEMWLLGTGKGSAEIAAQQGLSYAYAHLAKPGGGRDAVMHYRDHFRPSSLFSRPIVMISVFAVVAETLEESEMLAKALDLWLLTVESSSPPPYYPSVDTTLKRGFSALEKEKIKHNRKRIFIGTPEQVANDIQKTAEEYQADEVTIVPNVFGSKNRMKGIALLAEALDLGKAE